MNSYISRICFSLLITLALSSFMVGCANDKPAMTDEVVSQHVVITLHEKKVNIDQLVPYQYTYKVEFLSDLLKIGTEKEEKKRYYVLERIGTLFRPRNYFSKLDFYGTPGGTFVINASKKEQFVTVSFKTLEEGEKFTTIITNPVIWYACIENEITDPNGRAKVLEDAKRINKE